MERLRFVGRSEDGEDLIVADEDGHRYRLPMSDVLREALAPEAGREDPAAPEHHVRLVPEPGAAAGSGPSRSIGGLAPGAFRRAGFGAQIPLRGVRALIGESGALAAAHDLEPAAVRQPPPIEAETASPEAPEGTGLGRTAKTRLTTGQIQARLRAGESVQAVAGAAGVPEDWVARLDQTIARERLVLVSQMLHERLVRGEESSTLALAESIVENLRARGVPDEALESGWSASRDEAGPWRVRFAYTQGGLRRQAEWTYDPRTRELRAVDEAASRLGWVGPEDA